MFETRVAWGFSTHLFATRQQANKPQLHAASGSFLASFPCRCHPAWLIQWLITELSTHFQHLPTISESYSHSALFVRTRWPGTTRPNRWKEAIALRVG